jgi:hypothetical protein
MVYVEQKNCSMFFKYLNQLPSTNQTFLCRQYNRLDQAIFKS